MGLFFNSFPSSHFIFLFLFFSFLFFSFLFFSFFVLYSLFFIIVFCSFLISYLLSLISYFLFLISYSVLIPILSFPLPLFRFSAKTNNPVLFLPLASPLLLPALFLYLTPQHHPSLTTPFLSFFPFSIKNKRGEKLFIWGLVASHDYLFVFGPKDGEEGRKTITHGICNSFILKLDFKSVI